jgi:hypothetical protein
VNPERESCVRCGEVPAVKDGLCGHCTWALAAEIETGFRQLRAYLQHWAEFRVWEREHGGVSA